MNMKSQRKMAERKKKNPIKKPKKNWQNMSNKNFSRKMMVSKEAVVFYGLILNLEEKILYFLFVYWSYAIMNIIKVARSYFF